MSSRTCLSATNSCRPLRSLTRLHPQAVDPVDDARIEIRVRAHGVIDLRARLHQPRQYLVDVRDRKGIVRRIALDGAFGAGARAVPRLAQRVVLAHEQQVFRLRTARHQHRNRIRFRKAGQVVEVAVLPIGILDVAVAMAHRRRRQDRDRILADHAHELAPPARELLAVHRSRLNAAAAAPDRPAGAAAATLRRRPGPRPG